MHSLHSHLGTHALRDGEWVYYVLTATNAGVQAYANGQYLAPSTYAGWPLHAAGSNAWTYVSRANPAVFMAAPLASLAPQYARCLVCFLRASLSDSDV